MGGGESKLEGPDLCEGVPRSVVLEKGIVAGHAFGESLLLVNGENGIHAIGATCTHYGGPLADGLVVGDTIHCPWHHACFALRTGEAVGPPALHDLSVWTIADDGETIRITGRNEAGRGERTPPASPDSVVIIGAGAAGNSAAETLRRAGYAGPITLIDPDAGAPCDRPNLSKDYLAGNAPEEWIPLHPPEFYAKERIEIVRSEVASIDTTKREIVMGDGTRRSWGALILATGAEPVHLPIPNAAGTPVFTLRTLADSRAIIGAAESASRAVVIGASFIGLEVAASLRKREVEVHVVAPEPIPLARVMGDDLGHYIRSLHEENGVQFHLGHTVREIGADHVVLDDGTRVAADFVVAGVGVRPRIALAEEAGITCGNGILVDEELRTSAADVWAAGDVANWPDPRSGQRVRIEHWALAQRLGQTAARNALGAHERFDAVPFFWSQHYDAVIAYVGHAPSWDQAKLEGDPAAMDCAVTFTRGGRRLALATIFRDTDSLRAEAEMQAEVAS
jgi:apoptosis-inducing factor 3